MDHNLITGRVRTETETQLVYGSDENLSRHKHKRYSTRHTLVTIILIGIVAFVVTVGILFVKDYVAKQSHMYANLNFIATEALNEQINSCKRELQASRKISIHDDRSYQSDQSGVESTTMTTVAVVEKKMSKVVDLLTYRIPKEIKPRNYNLYLHPNLDNDDLYGVVKIYFDLNGPIQYIPVHTHKLTISSSKLFVLNRNKYEEVKITQAFGYESLQYWVIETEKNLERGQYLVELKFNGTIGNRIIGFYSSSYFDKSTNTTKKLASSKFQPTYAREAFPCFDEPALKAEFEVNLVRPKTENYHGLSNMEMISESQHPEHEDLMIVHFAKTVPMSTYLLCFVVSDFAFRKFDIKSTGIGKDFYLRIFASPDQINKTEIAGYTAAKGIEYYTKYFDIPYPLPKLDVIALPVFVAGASEHWGLVTCREQFLLHDENYTSTLEVQENAYVMIHELGHMWYGNLVTMEWWNEIWLNEGFASYMHYKVTDAIYPHFGLLNQMLSMIHYVYTLDDKVSSHPIVNSVESPDQINEIFDKITYYKSSAVIKMLESLVGEENFRIAVSNYLKAHKYSNAKSTDLLRELEKIVPDMDITLFLNTWIQQRGYPLLTVEKSHKPNTYRLTQKKFVIDPEVLKKDEKSEFDYRWEIFLTYYTDQTKSEQGHRKLLSWKDDSYEITVEDGHSWLKLNKAQLGYYRVNYSREMWHTLIAGLKTDLTQFSIGDRANLIDDAFSLAEARVIPYDIVFELTQYLVNETDLVPWTAAITKLNQILRMVTFTDIYEKLQVYIINIIENVYQYVGWDIEHGPEFHSKNILRTKILAFACSVGHKECLAEAGKKFVNWLDNPLEKIHPDLKEIIYHNGMINKGTPELWDKMWKLFTNEQDAQEKHKMIVGLSGIQDPLVLNKYIQLAANNTHLVRTQEYLTCLEHSADNKIGLPIVWDFIRENWQVLVSRYTLNDRYFGRTIGEIASKFTTSIKLSEVQHFFELQPEAGAGQSNRILAVENIRNSINWIRENSKDISHWLENTIH